jgi:hypothetical protein
VDHSEKSVFFLGWGQGRERIAEAQAEIEGGDECHLEGNIAGIDEGMAPKDRLGGVEQGRAKSRPGSQPATGEQVKENDASLEDQEGQEVGDIRDNQIREETRCQHTGHQEPGPVMAQGRVAEGALKTRLEEAGVGGQGFFGVVEEVVFVPRFAVVGEGEQADEQVDKQQGGQADLRRAAFGAEEGKEGRLIFIRSLRFAHFYQDRNSVSVHDQS